MLHRFIQQVRHNCQLASATQAGLFSLCGLLLRLRQLYKWEHDLLPWQEPEAAEVLDWITAQEGAWNAAEDFSWNPLPWDGSSLDPFAVDEINALLRSEGLIYGAGFGRGLAPTFFLGELVEIRTDGDLTILVVGDELARDLEGAPALTQGKLIYARTQTLAFYLWDRLADPTQGNNRFLKVALPALGLRFRDLLTAPQAHQERFCLLLTAELEAAIHHEIGEAREESVRAAYSQLLELFPQTRIELWIRSLKDALADVNEWGRLTYIIREQNLASFALMLAFQPGLLSFLLPELEPAFWEVAKSRDWQALDRARAGALARLRRQAKELNDLLAQGLSAEDLQSCIQRRFLSPLGL
jgi:hypothetical protein|uniref:Uncharacterized protein n=1 Tax=Desulfobacca acetoxidans TaxID=60893 RepID=A0A7C3SK63_9BACT